MNVERITLRLVGVGPMLMRSARLADPLDPLTKSLAAITAKAIKTDADHTRIAHLEWSGGLWLHDGRPCLPAQCLKRVLVDSAKKRKRGNIAKAAFMADAPALLEYEGPQSLDELWADERFRHREMVRVHLSRTMRTRPCFPKWSTQFSATFLTTMMNRAEVIQCFQLAGPYGIGDHRPEFGRFLVEEIETQ
jgi:hypothetical protein